MKNLFYKVGKYFLTFSLLASIPAFAVIIPPPPTPKIKLEWDYPAEQLSTNLTFNIYHTTDLSVPITQWSVLTNVVGTNLSVMLPKEDGTHFFAMTASNESGESSFATVSR